MIRYAILLIVGAACTMHTGQWFYIGLMAGVVAAHVVIDRIERRDRERHKAVMAQARTARTSWIEIGTVRRDANGGYELWNGKVWVKV